jgi:uncharacterized protein YdiU (UPF0061 family)
MRTLGFTVNDSFSKELPADTSRESGSRTVTGAAHSFVEPRVPGNPKVIHVSEEMATELGLSPAQVKSETFTKVFTGAEAIEGSDPYAMCYGGHQFGNWAGQLGDGRAINLAEVESNGQRWTLQLKGAGPTPYSRGSDGLAVLRSSVREHLCSEAMHNLGIWTSRSLSLALTGDQVMRDVLYNGNAELEKGAIVCRVSKSFVRFGSFQIHLANKDLKTLKALVDHTIAQHYPHLVSEHVESYSNFFKEVCERSLETVINWQRVGFVHGVMNTDNISILGDTIDYGPYGWLEGYDQGWTPNTTDAQNKRYRYGMQPEIMFWNLLQLANALYPLLEDTAPFEEALAAYKANYLTQYRDMMKSKIGLDHTRPEDDQVIDALQKALQKSETDMTIFFRNLADYDRETMVLDGHEFLRPIMKAFYEPGEIKGDILEGWRTWFKSYHDRLEAESRTGAQRKEAMNKVNPKYVLRNYMSQLAIDAADDGDYGLIDELYKLLKKPYSEQSEMEKWFVKRPEWARHKVGCSMLSCSS